MDILCLSTTDWDEIWGSRQQIMLKLAENGHRILFVERQVSLEQFLRDPEFLRRKRQVLIHAQNMRQVKENIWLFKPPFVSPGRYYSHALNKMGQRKIAQALSRPILSLGFKDFLLWIYPPQSSPIITLLKPKIVVYHCIDHFAAGQRGKKRAIIQQQEYELIQYADCIFVNSKGLIEKFQGKTNKTLNLIPSAVDVFHFQKTEAVHPDMDPIPHPRLGFSGTLDARVDGLLIEKIALSRPEWHIIILGNQRPGFLNSSKLHSITNIHFLGKKSFEELPLWFNGFDVFLIPYVQNERSFYISPLKFYEYLAVGKPIVSVPLPEISNFHSLYLPATSPESFIDQVEVALSTDTREKKNCRRQTALLHSWDERVKIMTAVINNRLSQIDA
jgi:glycosyltransferase involved in cell wall biosynthesis